MEKESQDIMATWTEKLDYLENEIRRRDRELERLRSMVDEQQDAIIRLQQKKKELEQQLHRQDADHLIFSENDREHRGDRAYWTGKRLHTLRQAGGLSYREMEQKTGIPKSTVQRRVRKYRQASTR